MAPSYPHTRRRQGGGASSGSNDGVSRASTGVFTPPAAPAAVSVTQPSPTTRERSRASILAHRNSYGEPEDPALDALFARETEGAHETPRRGQRDRRPTERAAAAVATNFESAFAHVADQEIQRLQGTDRDVTILNAPEEEEEVDEEFVALLNDPSVGGRRSSRGRGRGRGRQRPRDPKPAAGLFVMGGSPPCAPAASILDEETAAARHRRFGGSGLLPPQVNANRVLVGESAAASHNLGDVPNILEIGCPIDQEEMDDEAAEAEAAVFAAEEAGRSVGPLTTAKPDLEQLKKGVVAESTLKSYIGCLQSFFHYLYDNQPTWLTPLGKVTVEKLREAPEAEKKRAKQQRLSSIMDAALSGCLENAYLVDISSITPDGFMEFILSLEKEVKDPDDPTKKKMANLSKSAYDNHRSALNHLYRLHNGIGLESLFAKQLALHYQSHKRWLSKNLPAKDASGSGKEAIPVALYRYLCKCFFEMGTREGVFCHAYLLLTWNLGCRANNTAKIRLCDLHCSSRDCFSIAFSHTKNDQLGNQAKHKRQLFANPWDPLVCPFFVMSLYFSTTFADMPFEEGYLFPFGTAKKDSRHKTFNDAFNKMVFMKRDEIQTLFGMRYTDIGSHSIRKGTISYLSNLPGGPQQASICIRAGWTMGTVKDAYMRYMEAGDAFAGRCLAGLNLLSADFACSTPLFLHQVQESVDYDASRLSNAMKIQLAGIHRLPSKILFSHLCFASFLHHRRAVLRLPSNHVVRESCAVLKDDGLLSFLDANKKVLLIARPWTHPTIKLAGIPPHAAYLAEMEAQKTETRGLVEKFHGKLVDLLDEREIGTGPMAPERLKGIISESLKDIRQALKAMDDRIAGRNAGTALEEAAAIQGHAPQGQQERHFPMHFHTGKDGIYRMNSQWRWPRSNARAAWIDWNIGCTMKGEECPPLSWLLPGDFKWLDEVALMAPENDDLFNEIEAAGRTGKEETRLLRRGSSKVYSDLKVLMVHFENLVHARRQWPTEITMEFVQQQWAEAIQPWMDQEHKTWSRYSWNSSLRAIRRKKRMPTWVEIQEAKRVRLDGMDMTVVEDHGVDLNGETPGVEADQ